MAQRQMHLGVFVLGTGNHIAGWRMPGAYDSFQSLPAIQHIARIAERGCFDLLFLGDGLAAGVNDHPSFTARFEPISMLAALATTTTHLGLGATMSTSYMEPFNVARFYASLDHLSGGRAAWNAVTSSNPRSAPNFGREHPPHDARYRVAEEFVDVVMGLWDCWDEGAIVAERDTGRYIDGAKVRALDHEGEFFRVKGPLNIGRCPQGRPIILQAGSSEPGLNLAARTADVVFSVVQDLDEARAAYVALKSRMPRYGRRPEEIAVLQRRIILAVITVLLLSSLAGLALSRVLGRRIGRVARTATALASGDLSARAPQSAPREVATLADGLNRMADQIEGLLSTVTGERDRARALVAGLAEGVVMVDASDEVLIANDAADRMLGVGRGRDAARADLGSALLDVVHRTRVEGVRVDGVEIEVPGEGAIAVAAVPLREAPGTVVLTLRDVTSERALARKAVSCPTGIPRYSASTTV